MHRKMGEFLLVEGIQQTDFDMAMSINMTTGNDPVRQQRLLNITCYRCGYKGHFRKDFPSSVDMSPVPDQTMMKPMYRLPPTVTWMVTVSYAVSQSF